MKRFIVFLWLSLFLAVAFPQRDDLTHHDYFKEYLASDELYRKAEQLSSSGSSEAREDALNRQALLGFRHALPAIEKARNDSLAFHCYYKIAVLEHYFDSVSVAKYHYETAISIQSKVSSIPDSFLFKPFLFIGGIQYSNNQFDSAMINFKKAEQIASRYKVLLEGTNRLYNTLGAMYFETANYTQAKNYFEKSISLLGTANGSNQGLMVNYKINLAATLTRLEEFNEADRIYQELLKQPINHNDVLHNLGTIQLRTGSPAKALDYFKQVHYSNNRIVRLMNDIGQAYYNMNQHDSALAYYRLALVENEKWNKNIKSVQAALSYKYLGDIYCYVNKFSEGLASYQQAIIQLANDFDSTEIYANPEHFTGVFSYINLFNTLTAKADALERFYEQTRDIRQLKRSLDAYRSAFKLADYVERTYESDEARLFLNKIKYTAHSRPIDVSLMLYGLEKKDQFLEDAYLFDQQNKASILSLNIHENELKIEPGATSELLRQESAIRSSITRLSLRASQTTDRGQLESINTSIRDLEIQLSKLQGKINADPAYRDKQVGEHIPTVKDLQKILDASTALLSYHLSADRLIAFVITNHSFDYRAAAADRVFFGRIDSLKASLSTVSGDEKYSGTSASLEIYRKLIGSIDPLLSGINRLIIIPDDELNYLPFEALQDEKERYLVEKFSIQYQYSTALLEKHHRREGGSNIAFAPFTSKNFKDSSGFSLSSLPASADEVNALAGRVLIDSTATKQVFLRSANHYRVVHLATHASVNNASPLRSFIAFYPGNHENDYKLYAGEIYNMALDSTELVILSACETGTGKLVRGEGLMSLSRAFAYAGCPNIITSLWKAEDKTTAFITKRIHFYLEKGYSNDEALRQSKLDLLKSREIDPRFKTPNYWAHLVFIGEYEPNNKSYVSWWIAGIALLLPFVYLVFRRINRK